MVDFEVECPHCKEYVIIEQINCAIFRHGVLKENMQQINPHLPQNQCNELKDKDLIYGCGKPFKLENINGIWTAIICDYI